MYCVKHFAISSLFIFPVCMCVWCVPCVLGEVLIHGCACRRHESMLGYLPQSLLHPFWISLRLGLSLNFDLSHSVVLIGSEPSRSTFLQSPRVTPMPPLACMWLLGIRKHFPPWAISPVHLIFFYVDIYHVLKVKRGGRGNLCSSSFFF